MTVRSRPYQRRRRGPLIVVVSVLAVAAILTWTTVLVQTGGGGGTRSCPAPAAGPAPGQVVASDVLDATNPVPAASARVRVLNAGGQRGQANLVAAQLGDLGFAQAAPPDNDPFYIDTTMECVGQIRFGPGGEAAASTVALVIPCAELVRDTRTDDTVDVSVGAAFRDLNPAKAARTTLEQLARPPVEDANADPDAAQPAPPTDPTADPAALAAARAVTC